MNKVLITSTPFSKELDFLWNEGNADWNIIIKISETILKIHQKLILLTEEITKVKEIKNNLANLLSDGINAFTESKGKVLLSYMNVVKKQDKIEKDLTEILSIDYSYEHTNLLSISEVLETKG